MPGGQGPKVGGRQYPRPCGDQGRPWRRERGWPRDRAL